MYGVCLGDVSTASPATNERRHDIDRSERLGGLLYESISGLGVGYIDSPEYQTVFVEVELLLKFGRLIGEEVCRSNLEVTIEKKWEKAPSD